MESLMIKRFSMLSNNAVFRPNYLKFTATEDNSSIKFTKVGSPYDRTFEYAVNGGAFQTYTVDDIIQLDTGDYVEFRKEGLVVNTTLNPSNSDYWKFVMTGKIAASGNIMSLLDSKCTSTTVGAYAFCYLFTECASLVTPPELPAITINSQSYRNMFNKCSNLTEMPYLPSTTMKNSCYYSMFSSCSSLRSVTLIGSTMASNCYTNMFSYCTGITSIHVNTLNNSNDTFQNNTSCNTFIIDAVTPPTISNLTIAGLKSTCIIYVPDDSVDDYKTASYWSARADYIKRISELNS